MSVPKRSQGDKVDRFIDEYLIHLNATRAYQNSHPGVTAATAATEGSRLLGKPEIQKKIAAAKAERSKRTHVTQDKVIRELARIAFLDIRRAFDQEGKLKAPQDMPGDLARAMKGFDIQEIWSAGGPVGEVKKVRFDSKVRALEILLEHVKTENEKAADSQPVTFLDLVKKAKAWKEKTKK